MIFMKNKEFKIKHSFKDSYLLNESQIRSYKKNKKLNKTQTLYNNPFKIKLNKSYSVTEIKKVIYKLYELFPVLSAHIIQEEDLSFAFDAIPQINGSVKNSHGLAIIL